VNFKSLIVVGLGVATLGLSLPAHADDATVLNTTQDTVITGNSNTINQDSKIRVNNNSRKNRDSAGTNVDVGQKSDVLGNRNDIQQTSDIKVRNDRRGNR
jgi:hypothetical protein